jgi:hypothetical protein
MPRRQTENAGLCFSSRVAPNCPLNYTSISLHVSSSCTYPTPPYAICKVQPTTHHAAGNHLTQPTSILEDGGREVMGATVWRILHSLLLRRGDWTENARSSFFSSRKTRTITQ